MKTIFGPLDFDFNVTMGAGEGSALAFRVLAKCSTTRARVAEMTLPHSVVDTPVFMPVGTQVLSKRSIKVTILMHRGPLKDCSQSNWWPWTAESSSLTPTIWETGIETL